jgi:hypothetical protein
VDALEQQKHKCQCAINNFNKRYDKYFVDNDFDIGTWVLLHEMWLDDQHRNKGAHCWSGPFAVHKKLSNHSYQLREIDGTIKRGKVAKDWLKIFYYREDRQTIKSVSSSTVIYPFPIKLVPLDSLIRDSSWMAPYNINLIKFATLHVGLRAEGAKSIGELDNLMGTMDADECTLLDPAFPFPLSCPDHDANIMLQTS